MRSFKTKNLKLFRMCSYEKTGVEGVLLLTKVPTPQQLLLFSACYFLAS
jgi:hypothetical protein